MPTIIDDGNFSVATGEGPTRTIAPIPGVATRYVIEEDYIQNAASYTPLPLNTAHPTAAGYYLVQETPLQPAGAGCVRWTRVYAQVPASHDEFETFAYSFIGFFGSYGPTETAPTGRDRFPGVVQSRIAHDYFLVGAGLTYTTASAIPILQAQKYRLVVSGLTWWADTDWLSSNPPFTFATTPDRDTYAGWVANANQYKWTAGTISYAWAAGTPPTCTPTLGANPGQIIAEDSRLDRWMGNIWLRRTRYILAQ